MPSFFHQPRKGRGQVQSFVIMQNLYGKIQQNMMDSHILGKLTNIFKRFLLSAKRKDPAKKLQLLRKTIYNPQHSTIFVQ